MPIYKTKDKNKDGLNKYKVRINYTDAAGKAKQLTRVAYGLQAAKEMEYQLSLESKDNDISKRMTLNDLCTEYMQHQKLNIRETSYRATEQKMKNYILPYLKNYRIDKLTPPVLMKWKNTIDSGKLSTVSKRNVYKELRGMLNYAVKMEYINSNNLIKIGNFKDAYAQKKTFDFYTPEEYLKFEKSAFQIAQENKNYTFYLFFKLAYYTGARKGELNALTWHDYDGAAIDINKSVAQKLKGGDRITPPKNHSSNRTIQLPTAIIELLDQYKDYCRKTYKDFNDDYYICGGLKPLRDTSLANMQILIEKKAKVKHIRIHDFRHSHATLLANNGINILEIAKRLGHSNIKITLETYSHLYPQEEEKALKVLEDIGKKKPKEKTKTS